MNKLKISLFIIIIFMSVIASYLVLQRNKGGESGINQNLINLAPQTNDEGDVIVTVTPTDRLNWSFEISLDTHLTDIDEDLTKVAVFIDEGGNEHKPIEWRGDPPGGHHRSGTLYFGEITPPAGSVILVIRQVGGINERIFKWITQP